METFNVGYVENNEFVALGQIVFDPAGGETLTLSEAGDRADRLREVWDQIAAEGQVKLRRTERIATEGGKTITRLAPAKFARGDAGFPQAVAEYLKHNYGFIARAAPVN
jgi:hypothetical protein